MIPHKKIAACVISVVLIAGMAFSQTKKSTARLIVPLFNIRITPVEGSVFLPAFNLDLMTPWPDDLHVYKKIICGGNTTTITLQKNKQLLKLTLEKAVQRGYIKIFSITAAPALSRNRGLIAEPAEGIVISSFVTKGLVIVDSTSSVSPCIDTALFRLPEGGYDLNKNYGYSYAYNQQMIWRTLYSKQAANPDDLKKLQQEYVDGILVGSSSLPPYYVVTFNRGTIDIKAIAIALDPKRPTGPFYNDNGQHFTMLSDIVDNLKQLIAYPSPDTFHLVFYFSSARQLLDSIIITGRYKGIVQIRVRYTSVQHVMVWAQLIENQNILEESESYKVKLVIGYDFNENSKTCKIKFPPVLEYPYKPGAEKLAACNSFVIPYELLIGL